MSERPISTRETEVVKLRKCAGHDRYIASARGGRGMQYLTIGQVPKTLRDLLDDGRRCLYVDATVSHGGRWSLRKPIDDQDQGW